MFYHDYIILEFVGINSLIFFIIFACLSSLLLETKVLTCIKLVGGRARKSPVVFPKPHKPTESISPVSFSTLFFTDILTLISDRCSVMRMKVVW